MAEGSRPLSARAGFALADADLIVRSSTLVLPGEVATAYDLAIIDGRIVAIGPGLPMTGATEIEATGLHVFPGGIDPHVHFNEPGRADWEGIATGSRALAAGGFTTYVDMPLNNVPVTIDEEAFDCKLQAASGSSLVDFAFWGGLVPGNLNHLEGLVHRGVLGFKAFMCDSGIPEFPAADDVTLYEGMRRCAELGAMVLVHAESSAIVGELGKRAVAEGRLTPRDFAASRPAIAELEAIARVLFFAGETGCAVHIVHVSTARGVRLVEKARAEGVDVSCETCPHYLLLTEDDAEAIGPPAKCAPPLRSMADREGLWDLVREGTLTIVASDHSPSPPELTQDEDFFRAWGGISGCQTTLQLILAHGHARRGIGLIAVAGLTSTNAARRFHLPRKGSIEVGRDADLALFDMSQEWTLEREQLQYRHKQAPYIGLSVRGKLNRTLLRGRSVVVEGRIVAPPGGQLLTPERDLGSGVPRLGPGS